MKKLARRKSECKIQQDDQQVLQIEEDQDNESVYIDLSSDDE